MSLLALGGFAQQAIPDTASDGGVALDTDAVAHQRFIAVHGRRALIQGYAAEGLEAWAYPFQILNGYRIAFHEIGATSTIEGANILSRVVYEPDSVTRIYLGPNFIVREKLFVPLNLPGAILTYSIQSKSRIEIEVHAEPVLDLMWPGGLGGQSVAWNPSLMSFVLEEPANGITATVGSPDIVAHDDPGNRTSRGVGEMRIGFTLRPNASGIAKVIVALNPPHAADRGTLFRELIHAQHDLEEESATHLQKVGANVLHVETPNNGVNKAIAWAEFALDQAWVCNPDLGCGYVAGYGPSRGTRRPQYEWFFAGDGLIAADAALSAGDRAHARDELEFILHYQDVKTGMIWHELSQSAGFLDWAGKYPYMYVHVDITFQFLGTLARYVAATGDIAFAKEHWAAIEAAYRYCNSLIDPATALPRIPANKEGGNEQDRMSDDLGLSRSWIEAASGLAKLAALTGHTALSDEASIAVSRARNSIPTLYWDARESFWISGHIQSGQPMLERRSGPSEALTLHVFNPEQNALLLNELASSSFQTDWGSRSIGGGSAGFDPESYSKGSVSPLHTAGLAQAFWSEHRPITAFSLWNSLLPSTMLDSLGHMPEVLTGDFYRPQVESVPEQTWSSAGFLEATIYGLLGLQVDSIANSLVFAPYMPAAWNDLSVAHIRLSSGSISLALHRTASGLTLELDNSGGPFKFEFAPDLPLGANHLRAVLNHHPIAAAVENHPQQTNARVVLNAPHGKSEVHVDFEGGIEVTEDARWPELADPSSGVRIVDLHLSGSTLTMDADVPTGSASHVRLKSVWKMANVDGATMQSITDGVELIFAPDHAVSEPYRRAHVAVAINP